MSTGVARPRAGAVLGDLVQDRLAGADVRLAIGAAAAWLALAACAKLGPGAILLASAGSVGVGQLHQG